MPERYKSISMRARQLLSRDEGNDVDFKRNDRFDSEDLVAFANSIKGGAILLGVEEKATPSGALIGVPVGCRLTDSLRLNILNKAGNCVPPVAVEIVEENGSRTPFVRLEIPSGEHKPYCTMSGVYKIRGDGANRALTPPLLLRVFMETEASAFVERFKHAAESLAKEVEGMRQDLGEEVKGMAHDLGIAHQELEEGLRQLGDDAADAVANSEAASEMAEINNKTGSDALDKICELQCEVADLRLKLDSLLVHHQVRDRSVTYANMHGLLRYGIFEREEVSIKERKRLFFEAYPTARKEDWEEAHRTHASRRADSARKKARSRSVRPKSKTAKGQAARAE